MSIVPACGRSGPGARCGRFEGDFRCFSPDGRLGDRPGHQQCPRAGRDRDRPHAGPARKPRPARRGDGDFQPRWLAPGCDDQRTALRARLGLAGHSPPACRDGPRLGCAGLSGTRCGQSGSAAIAPAQGRLWSVGRAPRTFSETVRRSSSNGTARIKQDPNDLDAYHHRAHALAAS